MSKNDYRSSTDSKTRAWRYYELGRSYNNGLVPNQYRTVNTNVEFFSGNQWLHIPETKAMSRLAKPVFNIVKRITSLFVAALTSNETTISFDSLSYYDGENLADPTSNAAEYATAEVRNLMDKFKMNYRVREALFDGAQTGDYCAHFYWDADAMPYGGAFGAYRGEIQMEMVDGINVMFGNPNDRRVQEQPYVLIVGRDTVENLRAEKERFDKRNKRKGEADSGFLGMGIQADSDTAEQIGVGGKHELIQSDDKNGKCLYVYLYEKRTHEEDVIDPETGEAAEEPELDAKGNPIPLMSNGAPVVNPDGTPRYKTRRVKHLVTSVHVTKATKSCNIYSEIDTGLTLYPIAWGNWEHQKNQYHGRALVTGIIPNQIFINTMDYKNINSVIGCDLPWTIQLVQNNLVFCNTEQGVHLILNSSAALENNIVCVSDKVNGDLRYDPTVTGVPGKDGLLRAVREANSVCSVDTDSKYLLTIIGEGDDNNVTFEWDYTISGYSDPTWFRHNNIKAVAYFQDIGYLGFLTVDGRTIRRTDRLYMDCLPSDENGYTRFAPIEKYYQLPVMFYDTYDRRKNITSCIVTMRGDSNTRVKVTYYSDFDDREDLTDLPCYGWRLFPRDLSTWALARFKYARPFRRKPCMKRVHHFSLRIENSILSHDMSLVSVQVFYNYQGRQR